MVDHACNSLAERVAHEWLLTALAEFLLCTPPPLLVSTDQSEVAQLVSTWLDDASDLSHFLSLLIKGARLNDFRCFKDALVGPLEQDLFQEVSDCGNSEIGISVFNPKVLDASNFVLTPQSAHSQGHGMSLYGSEVPEVISQIR